MSALMELLASLRRLDVHVELNDGKLKIDAPKGV